MDGPKIITARISGTIFDAARQSFGPSCFYDDFEIKHTCNTRLAGSKALCALSMQL